MSGQNKAVDELENSRILIRKLMAYRSFPKLTSILKEKGVIRPTMLFIENDALMPYIDIVGDDDAARLVKIMLEEGVLEPHPIDYVLQCPHCGGVCVETKYQCPYCGSTMIDKVRIIQHLLCGHTNTETHFRRRQGGETILVCPVCNTELYKEGEDYKVLGVVYECRSCKRRIASPQLIHRCRSCEETFDVREAIYRPVYGLRLTSKGTKLFERDLVALTIEITLEDMGFKIKREAEIIGASGIPHRVDIYAERSDGTIVAVDVVRAGDETSALQAMVKKLDLDPNIKYILAASWISPDIANVLSTSNIPIVSPDRLEELKRLIEGEETKIH